MHVIHMFCSHGDNIKEKPCICAILQSWGASALCVLVKTAHQLICNLNHECLSVESTRPHSCISFRAYEMCQVVYSMHGWLQQYLPETKACFLTVGTALALAESSMWCSRWSGSPDMQHQSRLSPCPWHRLHGMGQQGAPKLVSLPVTVEVQQDCYRASPQSQDWEIDSHGAGDYAGSFDPPYETPKWQ